MTFCPRQARQDPFRPAHQQRPNWAQPSLRAKARSASVPEERPPAQQPSRVQSIKESPAYKRLQQRSWREAYDKNGVPTCCSNGKSSLHSPVFRSAVHSGVACCAQKLLLQVLLLENRLQLQRALRLRSQWSSCTDSHRQPAAVASRRHRHSHSHSHRPSRRRSHLQGARQHRLHHSRRRLCSAPSPAAPASACSAGWAWPSP